jgi:rifampicin phosphotransferase
MTTTFIFRFTETTIIEMVGGKGLNLMRLTQAGLPVPPGFIISTDAYRSFIDFNHIDDQLSAILDTKTQGQPKQEISSQIRTAFEQGELPPETAHQIIDAYQELSKYLNGNHPAVAVRSSATTEDLEEASFAGQQDTYLNVQGDHNLLEAIKRCFGSLWSERSIEYRARQGLAPLSAQLAVVIQQMVFPEAAGVAFTADPISGDKNQMIIDAVFGLGEALVSGLVTPDHIVVDKRSGTVLSYSTAAKTEKIVATASGTEEQPVPRWLQHKRVLNTSQTRALYKLGQQIEALYGYPQDVEWCLANGQFFLVQARPITTLPKLSITWEAPGEGLWLHGGGTFEMITEPITPLFETFLFPTFYRAIEQMLAEIGLDQALPEIPYRVVNGFIYLHMQIRLRPWHLVGVIKDFALHLDSMKQQDSEQRLYRETVAQFCQPDLATLTSDQIRQRMQALGEAGMRYWLQIMKLVQVIYRQEKTFTDFYNRYIRQPNDPEPEILLRGQKIMSWEAECSTFDLAQLAHQYAAVQSILHSSSETLLDDLSRVQGGRKFLAALEIHLERYGHQLSSFDLSLPTLADDPRPILKAVQAFLAGQESPYERQQQMTAQGEQAAAFALSRLSERQQKKFNDLLRTARQAARIREDALFDVGLAWTQMHRCALELGNHLVRTSVITQEKDVFWLTWEEIGRALSAPTPFVPIVAKRRIYNEAWSKVSAPYLLPTGSRPAFWWHWIFPTPELQQHPDEHTLLGLGVSPGKVTGVARVIHSLDEMENLNPGDILVARTTTPAWTPLFTRISGLITDLGGPLAHGSIVAREVGIPAVMGTGNATQKIRSGQRVTILGSEGKVILS